MEYKGYEIKESSGHGKAMKGRKRTSTIQVLEPAKNGWYILLKQFRMVVANAS